jgi:hypothetical protein
VTQSRQNSSVERVDRGAGSTKLRRRWSSTSSRLRVRWRRLDVEAPAALLLHLAADDVELLLLASSSLYSFPFPSLFSICGGGKGKAPWKF